MDETKWESYGTGKYEKCAECMVHCGYEATAVSDTIAHPLKALKVLLKGSELDAPGKNAPKRGQELRNTGSKRRSLVLTIGYRPSPAD